MQAIPAILSRDDINTDLKAMYMKFYVIHCSTQPRARSIFFCQVWLPFMARHNILDDKLVY